MSVLTARTAVLESSMSPPTPKRPPWLVVTQIFFGLGWLRAAAEKTISVDWWTGNTIRSFVAEHADLSLAWFAPILDQLVVPFAPLVAIGVLLSQLAIGVSLVINRGAASLLWVAMGLNLAFIAAGAVNPSIFYVVGQGAILLWLFGRKRSTASRSAALRLVTAVGVAVAAISAPFINTLHPAEVIDDPAIVLVMFGGLTALSAYLTHRAMFGRNLP